MMQGLLAARQYFSRDNATEARVAGTRSQSMAGRLNGLVCTNTRQRKLYWHWSARCRFYIITHSSARKRGQECISAPIASPNARSSRRNSTYSGGRAPSELHVQVRRRWSRTTSEIIMLKEIRSTAYQNRRGEGTGSGPLLRSFCS